VVADDPDAGETIARLFEHSGFTASQVDDVDAAVTAVEGDDPEVDLVVVDFRHGGTTQGLKLLDRVRGHDDGGIAQVRVIMTTDLDENRVFSWQSGVDGFLIRPFHADDLIDAVRAALGRDAAARAAHRQEQMTAEPQAWASGD
jgi:DNA-binding response OmpR family regulator